MRIPGDLDIDLAAPGLRDRCVGGAHEPSLLVRVGEHVRRQAGVEVRSEPVLVGEKLFFAIAEQKRHLTGEERVGIDDIAPRPRRSPPESARDRARRLPVTKTWPFDRQREAHEEKASPRRQTAKRPSPHGHEPTTPGSSAWRLGALANAHRGRDERDAPDGQPTPRHPQGERPGGLAALGVAHGRRRRD